MIPENRKPADREQRQGKRGEVLRFPQSTFTPLKNSIESYPPELDTAQPVFVPKPALH
jgi:hypothetical protein